MKYKIELELIVDTEFDSDKKNLDDLIKVINEFAMDHTPMVYKYEEIRK